MNRWITMDRIGDRWWSVTYTYLISWPLFFLTSASLDLAFFSLLLARFVKTPWYIQSQSPCLVVQNKWLSSTKKTSKKKTKKKLMLLPFQMVYTTSGRSWCSSFTHCYRASRCWLGQKQCPEQGKSWHHWCTSTSDGYDKVPHHYT